MKILISDDLIIYTGAQNWSCTSTFFPLQGPAANTTVTSEKVKVYTRRFLFCSNLCDWSGIISNQ